MEPGRRRVSARRRKHRKIKIAAQTAVIFVTTIVMLLVLVLAALFVLLKGPSDEAARLFALSAHETSAVKWLPRIYMSQKEYDAILNPDKEDDTGVINDDSGVIADGSDGMDNMVNGEAVAENEFVPLPVLQTAGADAAGLVNIADEPTEGRDELEVIDLLGPTYKGKIMLIHDPSRVQIASIDSFGGVGKTLSEFLEMYNAIGCINAGGFEDENGKGKGGIPDGLVIKNGQITYGSAGSHYVDVIGFDADNILHVGNMSGQEALNIGLVTATNFNNGPVLIKDGERQSGFVSGINPRSAIGQAADGTVILVAIEGRMVDSLGATFEDLTDIMEKYGAVNAGNLDGGSSSGMYYEGERITRSCSVIGDRPLPTAVVVLR